MSNRKRPPHSRFRFAIGTRSFDTKGAAEAEIRRILHGAELGERLTGAAAVLIADLFAMHPEAADKAARGVVGFAVQMNERDGCTARGFHVLHPDGGSTAFSYKVCLNPTLSEPSVLAAMRAAILLSQRRVRVAAFLRGGRASCAHCGAMIEGTARGEVHHEPPNTFRVLAREWIARNGEPRVVSSADWGDDFADQAEKAAWVAFHDARARRVVVCQPCHYRASRMEAR